MQCNIYMHHPYLALQHIQGGYNWRGIYIWSEIHTKWGTNGVEYIHSVEYSYGKGYTHGVEMRCIGRGT